MASNPSNQEPAVSSIYHIPVDERYVSEMIEEYEVAHANVKELRKQIQRAQDSQVRAHLRAKKKYQMQAIQYYYEELQLHISKDEIRQRASI